jgi:hypothetical protein
MRVCPTRSFSRSGGTAFTARTILALARTCPMVAFASRFQTQPLSINSSTREAWRMRRLSSVDMILPDIEFQLCRRDSRLGFLGDSFVFNKKPLLGVLREDAGSLSAVERRHSGAQAPVKFPQPSFRSGSADIDRATSVATLRHLGLSHSWNCTWGGESGPTRKIAA